VRKEKRGQEKKEKDKKGAQALSGRSRRVLVFREASVPVSHSRDGGELGKADSAGGGRVSR